MSKTESIMSPFAIRGKMKPQPSVWPIRPERKKPKPASKEERMTDRFTEALGKDDEDVMNLKAGIDGLVFSNWSDDDIAAGAVEMARERRRALAEAIASARAAAS